MDVGSLSQSYLANTMQSETGRIEQARRLAEGDHSKSTDAELLDVCKKFEAYFIEQVLKEVKKTVPDSTLGDGPNSRMVDFFMDETLQKVSTSIQEKSGLGLAQQMYEQMKRNYSIPGAEEASATETASGAEEASAAETVSEAKEVSGSETASGSREATAAKTAFGAKEVSGAETTSVVKTATGRVGSGADAEASVAQISAGGTLHSDRLSGKIPESGKEADRVSSGMQTA